MSEHTYFQTYGEFLQLDNEFSSKNYMRVTVLFLKAQMLNCRLLHRARLHDRLSMAWPQHIQSVPAKPRPPLECPLIND